MQDGDTMEVVLGAAPVVPGPAQVFTPTAAGALTPTNDVAGIDDFDGDDFAWVDQWIADGGDAAGFWAAPGEAGPLTGGIWGTPIGGVDAVGEAIAADEPASLSEQAQADAGELDGEGDALAAVGGVSSFAESMRMGMWSLSYD
jgi:hypothetical protein